MLEWSIADFHLDAILVVVASVLNNLDWAGLGGWGLCGVPGRSLSFSASPLRKRRALAGGRGTRASGEEG